MKSLILRVLKRLKPAEDIAPEIRRARQLIAAIDAGGIPLDPAIVTRIAENLGLEVSGKARMEDTIDRIRAAIERY
jgi:hypothetical protein